MLFNLPEFREFCKDLKIETKELGIVSLGASWRGTQEYFIQEVAEGLARGVHTFVVLKGRQVMISTACLALDLYWHFKYGGTSGTLITDTEENREMFRTTLSMYCDSLPNKWKRPIKQHNRSQMVIKNRSRIAYQVVGTKKKENRSVGVGKAIMYMHATEVSNWGDEGALADIRSSLAQSNPRRLYLYESTARGFNQFEEMWRIAKMSRTQKAIFVGWWRNDLYRKKKGSQEYLVYWDGEIDPEEKKWIDEVKRIYDFDIDDEQIAWWRWMGAEEIDTKEELMANFPPTEDYAFQTSGSKFFTNDGLNQRRKVASEREFTPYNVHFGLTMEETRLVDAYESICQLKVWEEPKANAFYCIGADPAYGSTEWKDQFALQIFRVFADGMEQVAEFCTTNCSTERFAWLILFLTSLYDNKAQNPNVMMTLEINGPGMLVWEYLQKARQYAGTAIGLDPAIARTCSNLDNYLYRRPDSTGAGGYAFHWKTTTDTKERMMNAFKDGHERGIIGVNSIALLEEMKKVERTEEGQIEAPGRSKDDRVIAAALATMAWFSMQIRLAMLRVMRENADKPEAKPISSAVGRNVDRYLQEVMKFKRVA
jgi:hypothetical protein